MTTRKVVFFSFLWYNSLKFITTNGIFPLASTSKKNSQKCVWGEVKSQEEVKALHDKIETHEEREAMQAEIELEQQIKEL